MPKADERTHRGPISDAILKRCAEWGYPELASDYAIYRFTDQRCAAEADQDTASRVIFYILQELLFAEHVNVHGRFRHVPPDVKAKNEADWKKRVGVNWPE